MKKLLFIQGGSRVRECTNGKFYVDGNFNNNIWKRYSSYCNELTVILRKINKKFIEKDIKNKFNHIDINLLKLELVQDVYSPKKNFLNIKEKKRIKEIIKCEIINNDKIIIRSIGNFYTNTALKYCKKFKKDYLIEVTGFAFDGMWHHSFLGKILAIPREITLKKALRQSPYAVYVTDKMLQKRYKCMGKTLGCSDVELEKIERNTIDLRINKIEKYSSNHVYKLGTAAFLNVKWKGIQDVIKALYELKKKGITNFEYELVGAGDTKYLEKLIRKYDLKNEIKILGVKKHSEVFSWLKEIDIYIQPSYQEGLCRSIIEAMSQACPVIATNAGGNVELIKKEFIFKKGNIKELKNILENQIDKKKLKEQAQMNFEKSKLYEKNILDKKRDEFYNEFINYKGEN